MSTATLTEHDTGRLARMTAPEIPAALDLLERDPFRFMHCTAEGCTEPFFHVDAIVLGSADNDFHAVGPCGHETRNAVMVNEHDQAECVRCGSVVAFAECVTVRKHRRPRQAICAECRDAETGL